MQKTYHFFKSKFKNHALLFDRILTESFSRQILWIMVFLVVLWVAMAICFAATSGGDITSSDYKENPILLPFYLLIDANTLSDIRMTEGGVSAGKMGFSIFTYLIGLLLFNAIIISVFSNYIAQRKQNYHDGVSRYKIAGHFVILGYDEMLPSIIDHIFRNHPDARILVLSAVESVKIRERLRKAVPREQFDRIIVNYGHRTASDYYPDIYLERARQIFVVGKRSLPEHDAINVECVESIFRYLTRFKGQQLPERITCVFEDFDTYSAFKIADIFERAKELRIDFIPYNYYIGWAKQVFINRHYYASQDNTRYDYPAVYGTGIGYNDPRQVHLVFVGTSTFAVAFALEAAQILHFPNFIGPHHRKSRITFIDLNADREMHLFRTRNRHFFDIEPCFYRDLSGTQEHDETLPPTRFCKADDSRFLDIEFEFIKGDAYSPQIQDLIRSWAEDSNQLLSLYVAMTNQRDNFCLSMNMPDAVYDREIPVFIRQNISDTFVTELRNAHTDGTPEQRAEKETFYVMDARGKAVPTRRPQRYANIYPFGMNDSSFFSNELNFRRAHLINYLYEHMTPDYHFPPIDQLNADPDIPAKAKDAWLTNRRLTVGAKWSNLYAAEVIPCKLASMQAMTDEGIDPETQLSYIAQVEHNRWNVEKLLLGYRKPLPEEDRHLTHDKTANTLLQQNKRYHFAHSDIRPYNTLDNIDQLDVEFMRYIHWITSKD